MDSPAPDPISEEAWHQEPSLIQRQLQQEAAPPQPAYDQSAFEELMAPVVRMIASNPPKERHIMASFITSILRKISPDTPPVQGVALRPPKWPSSTPASQNAQVLSSAKSKKRSSSVVDDSASAESPAKQAKVASPNLNAAKETSSTASPDHAPKAVVLDKVVLAISADDSIVDVTQLRDKFYNDLQQLTVDVRRNNSVAQQGFDVKTATEITNFWFSRAFGRETQARLQQVLKYIESERDGVDPGAGRRSEKLANTHEIPKPLRTFFHAFSNQHRTQLSKSTSYHSICQSYAQLQLYQDWSRLGELAEQKDPALIDFLAQEGFTTSAGVSYKALVNRYITQVLELNKVQDLTNKCMAAQGIAACVDTFGRGVLLFLPNNASSKISEWGHARFRASLMILAEIAPQIAKVCAVADKSFLGPVLAGERPRVHLPLRRSSVEGIVAEAEDTDESDDDVDTEEA